MQRTTMLTQAVSKQGEEVVYDTENLDAEHIWWEHWHVGRDCSMQLWRRALGRLRQRLKHSGVCVVSWHGDRGKSRLAGAGDLCCRKGVYLTKWQQRGFHGRHSLVFMVHNCKQLHDRMHGHCPRNKVALVPRNQLDASTSSLPAHFCEDYAAVVHEKFAGIRSEICPIRVLFSCDLDTKSAATSHSTVSPRGGYGSCGRRAQPAFG